jgi:wyosine [tRNA(Phe)-imidazoG37] synthetase (radical SAM superfamily)
MVCGQAWGSHRPVRVRAFERGVASMARVLSLQKGVIYGPVDSRRLGRSLGINLSAIDYKVCSFNCVYCHYGWTKHLKPELSDHVADLPTVEHVRQELERVLATLTPPPEYITFSGNGEPTLHPDFDRIVEVVLDVKRRTGVDAQVAILSNSTAAMDEKVRRALARLDVRIMKLDAGTQEVLERINRPAIDVTLDSIVGGLKLLDDITLQSVFVDGEVTNAGDEDVDAWIEKVGEIRPARMQVYSLENAPAMSTLVGVAPERLKEIAERVKQKLGITAETY